MSKSTEKKWFMENHEQMIGAYVLVLNKNLNWRGTVTSVVDEEYFIVNDGKEDRRVSMYHIRLE